MTDAAKKKRDMLANALFKDSIFLPPECLQLVKSGVELAFSEGYSTAHAEAQETITAWKEQAEKLAEALGDWKSSTLTRQDGVFCPINQAYKAQDVLIEFQEFKKKMGAE